MEKEIKKAKTSNYITFGIIILFVLSALALWIYDSAKPLCDSVTVSNLKTQLCEANDYILVKANEQYYEVGASSLLGDQFSFESWELVSEKPTGEILVAIRFAELYVLELHDGGYVAVYDGYASRKTVSYAYYAVPNDIAENLILYLQQNGIPHKLGDGTISSATFNH